MEHVEGESLGQIFRLLRPRLRQEDFLLSLVPESDDCVQWHFDVGDLLGRRAVEEPEDAPQRRLVGDDDVVVGPVELGEDGGEAGAHVEIRLPSGIPEDKILLPCILGFSSFESSTDQ